MAAVIWTGTLDGQTFRVVDAGAGVHPRLTVEMQAGADAMGARGWQRFEPIPTAVFEGILVSAGILGS